MKEKTGRILNFKTEHGYELKGLIEVLKDVLQETTIEFIQGDGTTKSDHKKIESDDEEEVPVKRGRKPKNLPKVAIKQVKKKPVKESDSDDISDLSESEEDVKKKKGGKNMKIESDDDSGSASDDVSDDASENESESDSGDDSDRDKSGRSPLDKSTDATKDKKKSAGGIKILTVNEEKTLILYVKLLSERFTEFNCKYEKYNIGIDLVQLYNYLRNIDKEGVLNGYIEEEDRQRIVFQVTNKEKESESKYKLKLMDINKKDYDIPPPIFDMVVRMKTEEFHKMCRDMSTIGTELTITCSDKRIQFHCRGNVSELTKTYINGDNVKIMLGSSDKKGEVNIVREIFEIRSLLLFNKCTNLCEYMQILLKNKYPLFIQYTVATLGDMTIGLVPKHKDDRNTYDERDDKYYEDEDKVRMKDL
jgi:proliferating cell nuclear antigen PCNA